MEASARELVAYGLIAFLVVSLAIMAVVALQRRHRRRLRLRGIKRYE